MRTHEGGKRQRSVSSDLRNAIRHHKSGIKRKKWFCFIFYFWGNQRFGRPRFTGLERWTPRHSQPHNGESAAQRQAGSDLWEITTQREGMISSHLPQKEAWTDGDKQRERGNQKVKERRIKEEREPESLGHNKRSSVWQSEANEKRQCKVARRSKSIEMKENEGGKRDDEQSDESRQSERGLRNRVVPVHRGEALPCCVTCLWHYADFQRWFWQDNTDKQTNWEPDMPRAQSRQTTTKEKEEKPKTPSGGRSSERRNK